MASSDLMSKWFNAEQFTENDKAAGVSWKVNASRPYKVYLNPDFADGVHIVNSLFPLLPELVAAYINIDNLNSTIKETCLTSVEAIDYIMRFDLNPHVQFRKGDEQAYTINNWRDYMYYVREQVIFAPDFTQWDKHTRKIEGLANVALTASKKVIEAHNAPEKRLPEGVRKGIYVRSELMQNWIKFHLNPVRAQDNYKAWKLQNDAPPEPSQMRRRRGYIEGNDVTMAHPTSPPTFFETPKYHGHFYQHPRLGQYLQDDLTIWTINIVIYLSCAIIQAISFSHQNPSTPSTSDYLSALQTALTQLLSALMTYILTIRNTSDHHLGIRYCIWFLFACILPVVAFSIFKWYAGMSALLSFLGTAVTGFLQVLLAIDMKMANVLP